jgi:hypothetical protein
MKMTDEQLSEIEARANAATDGAWNKCGASDGRCECGLIHGQLPADGCDPFMFAYEPTDGVARIPMRDEDHANIDFIIHARSDVPALVAEVRRLRIELSFETCRHKTEMEDAAKALEQRKPSYRIRYAVDRVNIFLRSCLRKDEQYGDWHGRLSPALAWSLAGVMAEYSDFMSGWTTIRM